MVGVTMSQDRGAAGLTAPPCLAISRRRRGRLSEGHYGTGDEWAVELLEGSVDSVERHSFADQFVELQVSVQVELRIERDVEAEVGGTHEGALQPLFREDQFRRLDAHFDI